MYVEFDLESPGDSDTGSFSMLRAALFRLQWDRWCEHNKFTGFQWSTVGSRVTITFDHPSTISLFALQWQGRSYRIVQ